jgi:hypothetical protein
MGRNHNWCIKVGYLGCCMNTRVSSTGPAKSHRIAQNTLDYGLNFTLNRALIGLTLPPIKVSTHVLHHDRYTL